MIEESEYALENTSEPFSIRLDLMFNYKCHFKYISHIVLPRINPQTLRETANSNKVEETKNLKRMGTERMEIIKSIFGEQLERDSS